MTYKPLPPGVELGKSVIHGLGLFASKDIPPGSNLGVSHVETSETRFFPDGMIRTPLGGFVNHSDIPNTIRVRVTEGSRHWFLVTSKRVRPGEELTVKYQLYEPDVINLSDHRKPHLELLTA